MLNGRRKPFDSAGSDVKKSEAFNGELFETTNQIGRVCFFSCLEASARREAFLV